MGAKNEELVDECCVIVSYAEDCRENKVEKSSTVARGILVPQGACIDPSMAGLSEQR